MSQAGSKVREAKIELYRKQGKIHAKATDGRFNRLRWGMVWITQLVFYGACWLSWNSHGNVRQAILFDIADKKFYLFGLVLWPQDALLLAFALIVAAALLFLVTALAGRLFCGFACPQTVYTAIFTWVEARIEGDHLERLRLDQGPLNARKLLLKSIKHGLWLLIAGWTAISFVGYFTPIRTLLPSLAALAIGPWESFWLIFYALFTYVQAGLAREAVCQHMCPYSRFQGALSDPATRNVAYDRARGEPRRNRRQPGNSGDCVDCGICVQVCPTGIDIRDGLQYQCINCGLCIDACNQVMDKMGYPKGLIRYSTTNALAQHWAPGEILRHVLRPRTIIYASLIGLIAVALLVALAVRVPLKVDVIRDRGTLAREVEGGMIENVYRLQFMNTEERAHRYKIDVRGVETIAIASDDEVDVPAASTRAVPVRVQVHPGHGTTGSNKITFDIKALDEAGIAVHERSVFIVPR